MTVPTYECGQCGDPFKHDKPGRIPERCQPCSKKRHKNYYKISRAEKAKRTSAFMDRIEMNVTIEEKKENLGQPSWDNLDSIPEMGQLFDHHAHDNGTGIDRGCTEN